MKKKLLALILTFALAVSICVPAFAEETGPVFTLPLKGIDVSEHRGVIDWNSVKSSGMVQFAIIRDGFGKEDLVNQTDDQFENNYAGATANGIQVGVYHYSYATSAAEAVTEAQFCLSILKGRHLTYPVFYDVEDKTQSNLTSDQLTSIINAFCNTISNAGYLTGIYSSANWYISKLDSAALANYDKWVAHYDVGAPNYNGTFAIWQTGSSGSIAGINGMVDLDNSYKDYTYVVPAAPVIIRDTSMISDTGSTMTLKPGQSYQFKFTPNGSNGLPSFTTGNAGTLRVVSRTKLGNSYYVKVQGVKAGCTAVYSTLPSKKPATRCIITVK